MHVSRLRSCVLRIGLGGQNHSVYPFTISSNYSSDFIGLEVWVVLTLLVSVSAQTGTVDLVNYVDYV